MAGRIESYIHGDSVTPNKGGSLVEVACETDFGAKSEEFVKFCKQVALLAFAYECHSWDHLVDQSEDDHMDLARKKADVEKTIGERVDVIRITRMTLSPDDVIKDIREAQCS